MVSHAVKHHRDIVRLADATMARARFASDALGHRLGQAARPPFSPTGPVDYRRSAGCERCPARVMVDVTPSGGAITSGQAIELWCTGVVRFTVDDVPGDRVVAFTGSRTDGHVRRLARHWAAQYTGHLITIVYPTTGPGWEPVRPGAAEHRRIGGSQTILSATERS